MNDDNQIDEELIAALVRFARHNPGDHEIFNCIVIEAVMERGGLLCCHCYENMRSHVLKVLNSGGEPLAHRFEAATLQ